MHAYFGNLTLIVLALVVDEIILKSYHSMIRSEKYAEQLVKDPFFRFSLDAFVSFKTILYLFYILILIVSQMAEFNPTMLSGDLESFISANKYSILLLIAVDRLISQFPKDREKIAVLSAEIKKRSTKDQG